MFDEFDRYRQQSARGVESLVAVLRIIGALFRHPRLLLAGVAILAFIGAVKELRYGLLVPVALVLLVAAFVLWRRGE